MPVAPTPFDGRGFCGRYSYGPWYVRLLDRLYRRRSVYVCRKWPGHWKLTILPEGTKVVKVTKDTFPGKTGTKGKKGWGHRVRTVEEYPLPIRSLELGHKYTFNRREVVVRAGKS